MYNILKNTFQSTLEREGKEIEINGIKHKVFFRRNETGNTDAYTTLFAPLDAQIKQGEVFVINSDKYFILKDSTTENDVYRKYKAIRINAEIKWMFGKNNLVIFDVFMDDILDSLDSNKNGITLSSKVDFMIPLDNNSRKIKVNGRFFCGSFHSCWKVLDINYLNGICYVSAERDAILPNDDSKNGIAGRYDYEPKPSTYKVVFDNVESIIIEELEQKTVKYSIYKDGVLMEYPLLTQTFIVDNGNYLLADDIDTTGTETVTEEYFKINVNNDNIAVRSEQGQIVITGMIKGTSTITASYSISTEDTVISDSIDITVVEKAVVAGDVIITPVYTDDAYFRLKENRTQIFQANITGVNTSKWNITLNNNGIAENTYYTAEIDNTTGKFTVRNVKKNTSNFLVFTITEETSGKTAEYKIKLWSMI